MADKIRVVWLCHFSNAFIREHLELQYNRILGFVKKLANKPISTDVPEFANWITNGISEFERIEDVELHIVSPYPHLKTRLQEFTVNGIYYHFFKNEEDSLRVYFQRRFLGKSVFKYRRNSKTICSIISKIRPEIVHLFGAENPEYATSVLNVPKSIITIAQLQTLMSDPDFKKNYSIEDSRYLYRSKVERDIILKADYIGTRALKYRNIIHEEIKPSAIILNTTLALNEPIVFKECEKCFDFVYFAANISKAADLALEAFGLAYQRSQDITLDVIGGYDNATMLMLESIVEKYGIKNAITFEGLLPTHEDVLRQIRKSRFALLPLRVDLTSGTIREAMSNGLPVVTTDTGELGTQKLNFQRKNALLSPVGDALAMADNMLYLIKDNDLAETLRQNGFQTRLEAGSNAMTVHRYVDAYKACIENKRNNVPLSTEITEV